MVEMAVLTGQEYIPNSFFNPDTFFNNTIGITYTDETPQKIVIEVEADFAHYLLTKPLHHSQKLITYEKETYTFSYDLVINPELENTLMSNAHRLLVLEPDHLRKSLAKKMKKALSKF